MKIFSDRRARIAVIAGALSVIVLTAVIGIVRRNGRISEENAEIGRSLAYLESLESVGAEGVHAAIRASQQAVIRQQLEETLQKLDSGETDIWSCFSDAVILGDSRADDFQYNNFLPKSRILADMGAMCTDAEKYLDQTLDLYPSQIYFTYGMNDVDGSWDTLDGFISAYKGIIQKFMDDLPYAEFFVSSIIPVNQHAIDNDANYLKIPEYNAAMKSMTEELGACWIDCDHLLDGHEDLYDTDGQHFFPDAYPLWARLMLKTRFEYESAHAADESAYAADESAGEET